MTLFITYTAFVSQVTEGCLFLILMTDFREECQLTKNTSLQESSQQVTAGSYLLKVYLVQKNLACPFEKCV